MSFSAIIASSRKRTGGGIPIFVGAIADLNVTAFDDTTITLDWTNPASTNALDYFEVYVNGSLYENTTDASEGWTITGLTQGTLYDIVLIAVDVEGNRGVGSNWASIQTWGAVSFPFTSQSSGNILIETTDSSNFIIDWGDGTRTSYASSFSYQTHTYSPASAGTMKIIHPDLSKIWKVQSTVGNFDFTNVSSLTSLTYLFLNSNGFTGNMTNISSLTSLTYLYLTGNGFTGVMTGVSSLTSLTFLNLNGNGFTGVMTGVSSLTSLDYLFLNGSGFTGVMTGVSSLTSLTFLYIIGNGFTGDMTGVSSLTSLTNLNLTSNGFTGVMTNISSLTLLTALNLTGNGFTGVMTGVSSLSLLTYLRLESSGFEWPYTSTLTANFTSFIIRLKTGELSNASDIDQMFIDINAAATTKSGSIDMRSSGAAAPTATSLAARNELVTKGRTILTN